LDHGVCPLWKSDCFPGVWRWGVTLPVARLALLSTHKKVADHSTFGHDATDMASVSIAINDLFEFEGKTVPAARPDNTTIEAMVQRQFRFLPQPLQINITDKDVSIVFAEEASTAKAEAQRLAVKAGKRAAEGDHSKAISTLKRALELQPSLSVPGEIWRWLTLLWVMPTAPRITSSTCSG